MTPEQTRSPGRPRCENAHQALLNAAQDLLREVPLSGITSASLAKRAGVSKATLYRWWPSKEAILLEGYFEGLKVTCGAPETEDAMVDLREHIRQAYHAMAGPDGVIFASLIADGHAHPEMRKALNDELNSPRCEDVEHLLKRAVAAGQLRSDLDVPLVVDQIFGPLFSRLMTGQPVEEDLGERVFEMLLQGLLPTR
ncbi:MAG: TetR/AcrR family transcriptional regulator [Planctomycetota bacterium]|nr:TetR/AcrR family transcriptional regulator [Planctomycetota bacterium]